VKIIGKKIVKYVLIKVPAVKRWIAERDRLVDYIDDPKFLLLQARRRNGVSDDLAENPKPWFTKGAIDWLDRLITRDMSILEYGGGGYSSLWWCSKAGVVYTVEASIGWWSLLALEFAERPDLLKRWRGILVPCDWNPDIKSPKPYWRQHRTLLSDNDIQAMEQAYLYQPGGRIDVVVIDGSVRGRTLQFLPEIIAQSNVELVVVDNTESAGILKLAQKMIPKSFRQIDFPATEVDIIPAGQNGKWMTSVWKKCK